MLTVFKKILKYVKYIIMCIKQNILSSFSNKKSFFAQSILMALNNITWLIVWVILFNKNGNNINGVEMNDILYLWSLPVISFGLVFVCFGGVEDISSNISKGNLDVYLCQPKYSLIGLLTTKCRTSAIGDLIYGLIIGLFATNFNILNYIFLIVLAIFSSIILVSIFSIVHMLSFWFGNMGNLASIYTHSLFLTFTIYPKEMFSNAIKVLMYTIVPAYYCTHLPIEICKSFSITSLLTFFIVLVLFVILTGFVYNKGLKRYESGNAFNLK